MKKQGVISLGEAFIDYISLDPTNANYNQLLGGATVNVAVGASKLGLPSYYLCKLGEDEISQFVELELTKEKVNIEYCVRTPNKKICGVYVHINENGERFFHTYINPTPDEVLYEDELDKELFKKAKIFYFGSGTLFHEKAKKTTDKALKYAKETEMLVAFDANIRLKRWSSEEECRKTVSSFLKRADIVKMAEDELLFLTETATLDEGLKKLAKWKLNYVFITMGSNGACAFHDEIKLYIPAIEVNPVDTTGAGDAFMSALLSCFHEKGMPKKHLELMNYTQFASEIGAIATTRTGSLTALDGIQALMAAKKEV